MKRMLLLTVLFASGISQAASIESTCQNKLEGQFSKNSQVQVAWVKTIASGELYSVIQYRLDNNSYGLKVITEAVVDNSDCRIIEASTVDSN